MPEEAHKTGGLDVIRNGVLEVAGILVVIGQTPVLSQTPMARPRKCKRRFEAQKEAGTFLIACYLTLCLALGKAREPNPKLRFRSLS